MNDTIVRDGNGDLWAPSVSQPTIYICQTQRTIRPRGMEELEEWGPVTFFSKVQPPSTEPTTVIDGFGDPWVRNAEGTYDEHLGCDGSGVRGYSLDRIREKYGIQE